MRRSTFQRAALALAALMLAGAALLGELGRARAHAMEAAFQRRWGVAVAASDLQRRVAPLVSGPTRPVRMEDLGRGDEAVALGLVGDAFAVYPPGFAPRMLRTVALAGDIKVWGEEAGGFDHDRLIAVSFAGVDDPKSRGFDADTVHHEMSSLVKREVDLDVDAWARADPPGFAYMGAAGLKATLKDAGSVEGDATLHRMGFVSRYGQTSLENDWNTYAERVFGHGADFARLLAAEPAMRPKTRMLMKAYLSLDPRFAAYFDRTGLTRAAS